METSDDRMNPEAVEHLCRAGREFLLAIRCVIDDLADQLAALEARSAVERVERIPVRRP